MFSKEPVLTGEEDENHIFIAVKSKLYILQKEENSWTYRGTGSLKLNVQKEDKTKVRLIMRIDGALRLILNVSVWPQMPCKMVGPASLCITSKGEEGIATYLIKTQRKEEAADLFQYIESTKDDIKKIHEQGKTEVV